MANPTKINVSKINCTFKGRPAVVIDSYSKLPLPLRKESPRNAAIINNPETAV